MLPPIQWISQSSKKISDFYINDILSNDRSQSSSFVWLEEKQVHIFSEPKF